MAKELPVIPFPKQSESSEQEELIYSRVFCTREDSPPLKLLLDFLKSKNQIPLIPKMDPAALEDWDWVHVSLGYSRERKPIRLFCLRDRGTYQDVFEGEKPHFSTAYPSLMISKPGLLVNAFQKPASLPPPKW